MQQRLIGAINPSGTYILVIGDRHPYFYLWEQSASSKRFEATSQIIIGYIPTISYYILMMLILWKIRIFADESHHVL